MKPLNLDNSPCSPTSSNCVIWQGPDLDCINLCTGDTVSDVIYKLATELCTIMDTLKITSYQLTCFNLQVCPPETFQELIQFLIDRICELDDTVNAPVSSTGRSIDTCPDCVVSIAPCFQTAGQTTMQLTTYVGLIGERICTIFSAIGTLTTAIDSLDVRVTELENAAPPVFTIPSIIVDCDLSNTILAGEVYPINDVLNALVNNDDHGYCALLSALGQPTDILSAVASACITSTTVSLAYAPATMGASYGTWITSPFTLSDSVNNIWLSICDIYEFLTTSGTYGKDGRGVAVFVGGSYGSGGPTDTNLQTEYAGVAGFTVNNLPGSNVLKAGDLWIRICP